jgi:hypothetical protein
MQPRLHISYLAGPTVRLYPTWLVPLCAYILPGWSHCDRWKRSGSACCSENLLLNSRELKFVHMYCIMCHVTYKYIYSDHVTTLSCRVLGLAKSELKIHTNSIWVSKEADFEADFESDEKVAKNFSQENLDGREF